MLVKLQNDFLEKIARDEPLHETVDFLCRQVEELIPDIACSVLMVDNDLALRHLAGPSIPCSYSDKIDGLLIGEGMGSCGTAAFRSEPVIVTDIETHPFWEPFKSLALPLGYLACWSTPIIVGKRVMGTFAFYYHRKRGPSELEQQIVATCVHLCAIGLERQKRENERYRLAYTDALTGLGNRARFNEVITHQGLLDKPWGLLLLDLDNLKIVNDSLGHQAGDDLIQEVGRRLKKLGQNDMVFRLGGDEFAMIVCGEDCVDLGYHAAYVMESLKTPCICAERTVYPSATLGGASALPGDKTGDVRQKADFALYEAKSRQRGGFLEYSPVTGTQIARRFRIMNQLRDGLQENGIVAVYQPVFDLKTSQLLGLEALCRMRLANGDLLAAAHFKDALRDAQLARDVTRRMLDLVLSDLSRWLCMGLNVGQVAVNIATGDFLDGCVHERILGLLQHHKIPPSHLVIEIIETVYQGHAHDLIRQQVMGLQEQGVKIALDDFGSGPTSLNHLLAMNFDIIKLDRSLLEHAGQETKAAFLAEELIKIARYLGAHVTAEGIERQEQADMLLRMGCDSGQGYYFSKPILADEIENMLWTWQSKQSGSYGTEMKSLQKP
ncbi:EAL domain-containing protein [Allorhizobium sp. BGMRC 0089]|uniref:bifunctional diguanylate cyclase/phosphodiesterase n=1 Tax=Allorhizobium sonneratiae TaxID=2934936 RepID=UPI002033DE1E|nr:GGDEF domain-containing protein [Allorhizobium sonneratiae]MCM2293192.1 EAL domain-containing protein [Allorhizobium sonneratiae]